MPKSERITLGSGKLYMKEHTGTFPEDMATFCTDDNLVGYIKGGATLQYTPTFYTAKDDLGYVSKEIITTEEVHLTAGVMTFNGNVLKQLTPTARVSEDSAKHQRTTLIGGVGNRDGKSYDIVFHHEDPADGDIWVGIVGTNQTGFSLAFAVDAETVIDADFVAKPLDGDGSLIKYIEEDASIVAA